MTLTQIPQVRSQQDGKVLYGLGPDCAFVVVQVPKSRGQAQQRLGSLFGQLAEVGVELRTSRGRRWQWTVLNGAFPSWTVRETGHARTRAGALAAVERHLQQMGRTLQGVSWR